jgi:hypothetical protein
VSSLVMCRSGPDRWMGTGRIRMDETCACVRAPSSCRWTKSWLLQITSPAMDVVAWGGMYRYGYGVPSSLDPAANY